MCSYKPESAILKGFIFFLKIHSGYWIQIMSEAAVKLVYGIGVQFGNKGFNGNQVQIVKVI